MKTRDILLRTAAAAALVIGGAVTATAQDAPVADIIRQASDLPAPLERSEPATVRVSMEAKELVGQLADGTTYRYWTFDGQVPGPFVRVRVGDTVEVGLKNAEDSWLPHNVDFHAVTG